MSTSFQIHSWRNRTRDFAITITDSAGTPVVLADTDAVRIKIGRNGDPHLDLSSQGVEPGGSTVTIDDAAAGQVTLRIGGPDTEGMPPGCYDMEVLVASQSDEIKHAQYGVLFLHPSMSGETDAEESSS